MVGTKRTKVKRMGRKKKMMSKLRTKYNGALLVKRTNKAYDADITGEQGFAFQFNMSALPNFSEFSNLFDRYKITGVKLRILFLANSIEIGSPTQYAIPVIHHCTDIDDANPPSTENEILQKNFVKTRRLDEPFTVFLRPKPTMEVFNSVTTTGYAVGKSSWIDMASSGIPHYGWKAWVNNGQSSTSTQVLGRLKIYATYYVALRDPQ